MSKEKKKKIAVIKNNRILLGYIWKFAPEMLVFKILAIVMILVSDISFNIIFLKYVIDSMSRQVDYRIVLMYIAGLALIRILCDCANSCYSQYIEPVARLKIHKGIYNQIYESVEKVDLEKFDDANFYNDYIWALNEVDNRTKNTFNVVIQFIQSMLNILTYSTLSMFYDKLVLFFVLIPVLVNSIIGVRKAKLSYNLVSDLTPVNRKRDYSRRGFYLQQYAKEIRTSRIGNVLRNNFNTCVDGSINITKKYRNKLFGLTYCETHAGWMFSKVLSAAYMSFKVLVSKAYTVGTFVVIYQAIGTFTNSFLSLFAIIPKLQENGMFAERLIKILNYQNKIEGQEGSIEVPQEIRELEIRNLSFRYPNSDKWILRNLNLKIRRGEKAALVGLNGAGKSTLIKLILRLYDPSEGCILVNGTDIREFNVREYRDRFSTIFQDYQIFAVKLVENIFMRSIEQPESQKAIRFMHDSQLYGFEEQIENTVTKEFDKNGVMFSGGQSQKLAIARAFAKNGDFVLMDEASSALDPIAEAEVNDTIMEKMSKKSFIIVSHRLSTIQNVDCIYFLQDGEIIESGSHEELLVENGAYAKMYNIQAEKYRKKIA